MKKYNGALAQLVEQWPFKPFVTGSNPVRPIKEDMKNIIAIFLLLVTPQVFSETIKLNNLNAHYLSQDTKSESIFIILHGTRGHKNLELITMLRESLNNNGFDSISINLSYGIKNRKDDFLRCDIEHKHLVSDSLNENVKLYTIDGADHFFRDFYFDDLFEIILDEIEQ